jgi:hypothetical protein
MNLAELPAGIILIFLGLVFLLLAILGMGRKKTFTIPLIKISFPAPRTVPQKASMGVIGVVLLVVGIFLLQPALQKTPPTEPESPPERESPYSHTLKANQVLFVSSGQLQIGGTYCGSDTDLICVLLYEATYPQTVAVESLDPSHSIYEVIDDRLPQNILDERQPLFWQPPNCTHGCQRAMIIRFKDTQLIRQDIIKRP